MQANFAIIGGSGLEEFEGAKIIEKIDIPTPFGMPSDEILLVDIGGIHTAFLPRHGKGHRILPSEVPSRANIWALKRLGVKAILALSAVGSLHEAFRPGEFVICDNLIDRSRHRAESFFGEGVVGHVSLAEPFCPSLRSCLKKALSQLGHPFHEKGTVICMEGPAFSTKAESFFYQRLSADLIGMTASPEAKLAREAEICYASLAMVTDYDCWHETEEAVTIEMVLQTMQKNIAAVRRLIPLVIPLFAGLTSCSCQSAAQHAIMTPKGLIPYEVKRRLRLFYGKYWQD